MFHNETTSSTSDLQSSDDCDEVATWSILPAGTSTYRDLPRAAEAAFDLPLDSDLIYILSRGSNLAGSVAIRDDGATGANVVKVNVRIYYTAPDILKMCKLCLLQSERGKNGVGIFTPPRSIPAGYRMFFDVRISLPSAPQSSYVRINSLETHLPNFRHEVGNLSKTIDFGSISLQSSNQPIIVHSLLAQRLNMKTSNGAIQGIFTSLSADLRSSNGPILADVKLLNGGDGASTLDLQTSNGEITAKVSLVSQAQHATGGIFRVAAKTSNGELDVSFPTAPHNSVLHLDTQTSNAPSTVSLHKTFEGEFRLQTSPRKAMVFYDQSATDPTGNRRTRSVNYVQDRRGGVSGNAVWTPRVGAQTLGSIVMKTSNADLQLVL
ncbi:hypothetical protein EW026_g3322 [Hermanssonia centrifuga]|uniref:DUF7330 domain-containing protein n=1 Tax=Hermanssonia centrifuga TaxID=98765 RepID=A0A4S4KMG8_9APHY|nr:hypothetical protein EW026_g3322 [Hermanssonia centrifuga]